MLLAGGGGGGIRYCLDCEVQYYTSTGYAVFSRRNTDEQATQSWVGGRSNSRMGFENNDNLILIRTIYSLAYSL
jgi:hypothetical protein